VVKRAPAGADVLGVMTKPDETIIYRSPGLALVLRAAGVWFGLMMIALLLFGPRDAGPVVEEVVGLVVSLWALLRLSRCAIYADAEGIRILNPLSTTRVRWDELRGFELPDRGPCRVERVDGSHVSVFGIQQPQWGGPGRPRGRRERGMIEELNGRLDARAVS
jgi:Bacterial PH domain